MIQPPADMLPELAEWNNGDGIDLQAWIACSGDFRRAVGYSTIFWPPFVLFEDYILSGGFTPETVRGFEEQLKGDKKAVEAVLNHSHIARLHYGGCEDITEQRIVFLGRILKEVYAAKLAWQFPDRPCEVSFYEPEDRTDLNAFQITFWQKKHAERGAATNGGPARPSPNSGASEAPPAVG